LQPRPFPIVISAPSGAGKTSLAHALVERDAGFAFSISATTRPPRSHEVHGRDYYFVDDPEFDRMIEAAELVEWAEVHGRRYGTPKRSVAQALSQGKNVVLDIDVQGARQVRAAFPDAVLIFVLPPSVEELRRRLSQRGSETRQERQRRLTTALAELDAAPEFDFIVVNDDFEGAVKALQTILGSETRRLSRLDGFAEKIQSFRVQLETMLERSA
jgi:guanylate kinase